MIHQDQAKIINDFARLVHKHGVDSQESKNYVAKFKQNKKFQHAVFNIMHIKKNGYQWPIEYVGPFEESEVELPVSSSKEIVITDNLKNTLKKLGAVGLVKNDGYITAKFNKNVSNVPGEIDGVKIVVRVEEMISL